MNQEANIKIQESISNAIRNIHEDYKKDGIIMSLRSYDDSNIISYGYLRKMVEMQILVNIGTGKRNARYKWNGGENPDYEKLAQNILDYTPIRLRQAAKQEAKEYKPKSNVLQQMSNQTLIEAVIGLTLELNNIGLSEEAIKKRIPDLLAAFSTKI